MSSIGMLRSHLTKMRSTDVFHDLFQQVLGIHNDFVDPPSLPKVPRKAPVRFDAGGSESYQWNTPEEYLRSQFYEIIDGILSELDRRFDQSTLSMLMGIEKLIIDAANNSLSFTQEITIPVQIAELYGDELIISKLETQLHLLPDVIENYNSKCQPNASITKVTQLSTIIDILANDRSIRGILSQVDKLLRIYLVVPLSNATAERSFSVLRRMKTYLRSTMTQQRLNHLMFLHIHQDITESIDLHDVLQRFCMANENRKLNFGACK